MLLSGAHSIRQQARLAVSLSWIGGYTNVLAFLLCDNALVSHVTGNATNFGRSLATAEWSQALSFGLILVAFYTGAVTSAFLTEGAKLFGKRSKFVLPLAIEALLLLTFLLMLHFHQGQPFSRALLLALTGMAAFAMGIQNATITKISGSVVRTTHLTGVLTDLGIEGVQYIFWLWSHHRGRGWTRIVRLLKVSLRHPTILRLFVLYSIFGSFLFGVVAGTVVFHFWNYKGLAAPVAFLLFIIAIDWTKPIADIREIDMRHDPDVHLHGLVNTLLPKEMALYRLTHYPQRGRMRAPNFQIWIDLLEPHRRVIILVLTPTVNIDDNAILDLKTAVEKLQARGGKLILGAVTPKQFRSLRERSFIDRIGIENICPDVEFAIARGAACVQELSDHQHDVIHHRTTYSNSLT